MQLNGLMKTGQLVRYSRTCLIGFLKNNFKSFVKIPRVLANVFCLINKNGIIRITLLRRNIENEKGLDLYVCTMTDEARDLAGTLLHKLRNRGISADMDYENRKLKAQMKDADRKNARYTIVLGEDEIQNQSADLKNMQTGETKKLSFEEMISTMEEI